MIKAIIFDVGGVIKKDFGGFKILAAKLNIDYNLIVKLWNKHEIEVQTHKMTVEEFLNIVKAQAKTKADIVKTWENIYYENFDFDNGVLEIIEKLKGAYKLAIISNVSEFHAKQTRKKGVYSHFDIVVLSHEVEMAKPQQEIFLHTLRLLNLRAGECVFIDDKAENTTAAKELGFKTIHFKNAEQLASELKSLGVTI